MKRTARVIVASNRAAAGIYPDRSGPLIAAWLAERAYDVTEPLVVGDGEPVAHALRQCLAERPDVVITTGGTGLASTDRTPEATVGLLDYQLSGLADAVRSAGKEKVPTAVLSRATAGVAGGTLVVNLPGSRGGVADGLGVLEDVLDHALDQLSGGDHAHAEPPTASGGDHAHAESPQASGGAELTTANSGAESPQASGGADPAPRIALTQVTESVLSVDEHATRVADDGAGAVVTFSGVVRDHDHGRAVRSLYYEGHPSASEVLATVADDVARRHELYALAVSHRLGALDVGDVALACAVAGAHRSEAFAACADLVDEAKARLPVWKHQTFADGSDEWVNCP